MSEVTLTDANFETEVLQSKEPVLVDFWATWCGPCKMLAPVVEELANDYAGKVKVCKLDVDQGMNAASKYQISSVPTLIAFKDGQIAFQTVGLQSKEALAAKLDDLLK
ncbi:MAG: thioredoxin [Elusimicrobiaceae bacterium]|nr:thioredoxin [Elusimicrobiaceae bacterium]